MKKVLVIVLAAVMVLGLAACGQKTEEVASQAEEKASEVVSEAEEKVEEVVEEVEEKVDEVVEKVEEKVDEVLGTDEEAKVMTYAEYAAAAVDDAVVIECYVQDHQSWWDNKISVYAADEDGAYFLYNMACEEADAEKLVPGTKIKVTGYKAEWSGEVEVAEGATFEFVEDAEPYIAEATDVTALLGTDELIENINRFVSFKDLEVAASTDADGNEAAYLYNWDGSGTQGDDLYFNVTDGKETYQFTVESYLRGADTDVYKAVEGLKVGDKIDCEGFLYWYNGANPHITTVTVK